MTSPQALHTEQKDGSDGIPEDIMRAAEALAQPRHIAPRKQDLAREIARAILAERQRDQWQDISTAPRDGAPVDLWGINHLAWDKRGERIVNVKFGRVRDWMGNERDDWQHGRGDDFEPTHWMPLPSPPKEEA